MSIALQGAYVDQAFNYQAPATGATITLADDDAHVIIDPAGTLAALTVKMCPNPFNGQFLNVVSSKAITTLTVSPNTGQTIGSGAPTALAAGQGFSAFYREANTTWYITNDVVGGAGSAGIPINNQSAAYTAVLGDANTAIVHPTTDNTARTFFIPFSGSVAYPIGTTLTFVNMINTLTISISTDTLTLAGTGSTGSRTLAANGIATALKLTSTTWLISGTGLT
jgi:hypothetical protein